TGVSLAQMGMLWAYNTAAAQTARWDNVNVDVSPFAVATPARALVWNGSSGAWESNNNWLDGANPATWNSSAPDGATFSNGALPATVTLNGDVSSGSITIAATAPQHTFTGGTLAITGDVNASQSATFSNAVSLGGASTWTVANGKAVQLTGG